MADERTRIQGRLAEIRGRIAAAAERSGRHSSDVTLVAVTKSVGPSAVRALADRGCRDIGESRPQQLWQKLDELELGDQTASPWPNPHDRARETTAEPVPLARLRWHQIGHLQRNKLRRTLPHVSLVHSVDSPRLLQAIHETAAELNLSVACLLEVNVSGEAAKHGFSPDAAAGLLPTLDTLSHVQVRGLMAMAGLDGGLDRARSDFRRLRQLRDEIVSTCPAGVSLDELSMGMSGDFEVAVEEGATIVRVGTALFE